MDGKCLHECIVYRANVVTNNECKEHFGTAEGEFRLRYNNDTMSFRHKKRVNDIELSKYLWKLKDENADYKANQTVNTDFFLANYLNYVNKRFMNAESKRTHPCINVGLRSVFN